MDSRAVYCRNIPPVQWPTLKRPWAQLFFFLTTFLTFEKFLFTESQLFTAHSTQLYHIAAAEALLSLCMHSLGSRDHSLSQSSVHLRNVLVFRNFLFTSLLTGRKSQWLHKKASLPWPLKVSMVPGVRWHPRLLQQPKQGRCPSFIYNRKPRRQQTQMKEVRTSSRS